MFRPLYNKSPNILRNDRDLIVSSGTNPLAEFVLCKETDGRVGAATKEDADDGVALSIRR
jgi:hypothetical protein